MDTLRIAVCEDNDQDRQALVAMMAEIPYDTQVQLFESSEDFLAAFQPYQYDLILMDIFMSGLTGIQALTQMRAIDPLVPVAVITSSQDFALESYRLNVLKYIEKPITKKPLSEALHLAQIKRQAEHKLVIRINKTTESYPISRISHLEQKGHALLIYLTDKTILSTNKKLDDVEDQLLGNGFLRCHKSYLVNLALVWSIDRELSLFEMVGGYQVHIRKRGFSEIQKAFEDYIFSIEGVTSHG